MMNTDPLEGLLEKLSSGDEQAAEQVFVAYEPYLRMVVRRMLPAQLQSKFDSLDVVQSVWVDVLHGFRKAGWRFQSTAQLRAFLVKATRNRFIDRVRQHRAAVQHEHTLDWTVLETMAPPLEPQPSEVVQAEELWQHLLALCPPAHQDILRWKRQGLSLAEIAARSGFHESSVRRILYDLAKRLASEESRPSGLSEHRPQG
jgi:RNA polymerase sigma-70 factor (ECF subfamily)